MDNAKRLLYMKKKIGHNYDAVHLTAFFVVNQITINILWRWIE